MGAALTYARRYALFTLVGIAGEDDVDAPDLVTPTQQTSGPEEPKQGERFRLNGDGQLNGGRQPCSQRAVIRSAVRSVAGEPAISSEGSAQLRDRLVGELTALASDDDAALWAHRSLPEKNKLTAADAQRVEEAFQARLASFATGAPQDELSEATQDCAALDHEQDRIQPKDPKTGGCDRR